jgi:hypothetical protein
VTDVLQNTQNGPSKERDIVPTKDPESNAHGKHLLCGGRFGSEKLIRESALQSTSSSSKDAAIEDKASTQSQISSAKTDGPTVVDDASRRKAVQVASVLSDLLTQVEYSVPDPFRLDARQTRELDFLMQKHGTFIVHFYIFFDLNVFLSYFV